jgi:competence protein ComEC
VVTPRNAPSACAALIIDRDKTRANGAMALTRNGENWEITAGRPSTEDRPWARAKSVPPESDTRTPARPAARDATPRVEDREPGD